jgi:hypothetical protein
VQEDSVRRALGVRRHEGKECARIGDVYTRTTLDADTKLIEFLACVGTRDAWSANDFMRDLAPRMRACSAKTDGHKAYLRALNGASGADFVRIHQSLRATPAMAAPVTDRLWSLEDVIGLVGERAKS